MRCGTIVQCFYSGNQRLTATRLYPPTQNLQWVSNCDTSIFAYVLRHVVGQ
jgi:hypothetical protein